LGKHKPDYGPLNAFNDKTWERDYNMDQPGLQGRVTNKAAADRMLLHWAELLAKNLGHVTTQGSGD